jgi:hypothetical protein
MNLPDRTIRLLTYFIWTCIVVIVALGVYGVWLAIVEYK